MAMSPPVMKARRLHTSPRIPYGSSVNCGNTCFRAGEEATGHQGFSVFVLLLASRHFTPCPVTFGGVLEQCHRQDRVPHSEQPRASRPCERKTRGPDHRARKDTCGWSGPWTLVPGRTLCPSQRLPPPCLSTAHSGNTAQSGRLYRPPSTCDFRPQV